MPSYKAQTRRPHLLILMGDGAGQVLTRKLEASEVQSRESAEALQVCPP